MDEQKPTARTQYLENLGRYFLGGEQARYEPYLDDPVGFSKDVLSHDLTDKQVEVQESVRDSRYTVVEAGHGVGKSFDAADLVCWWMAVHGGEAVALTIAPTHAQVQMVLWPFIRSAARRANLPGDVLETPRWMISARRFAVGLSPRRATQEDVASMQGYHSPNLLIIMDEAPGLPRLLWDAVKNLAVGVNNRVLAIGNPIEQSGPFWDACNSPDWKHIRMSCLEHPNVVEDKEIVPGAVSRQWVEEMIRDHCSIMEPGTAGAFEWPSDGGIWYLPDGVFMSRVLGMAPGEGDDQLIALAWVVTAQSWIADATGDIVIGLDPSAHGGDPAAMVCRRGPCVMWTKKRQPVTPDPSGELAGWLAAEVRKYDAVRCYVDEIGYGFGTANKARAMGLPVISVSFSRRARQSRRFFNLRAECWWTLREKLRNAWLTLPQSDTLAGDLTAPHFHYDQHGRTVIESKEKIRTRLKRSTDEGDALALTFADWVEDALPEGERAVVSQAKQGRWSQAGRKPGSRWKKG